MSQSFVIRFRNLSIVWAVSGLFLAGPLLFAGDHFLLHNGGEFEATWANRNATSDADYLIETAAGGAIRIAKAHVRQVKSVRPEELEYEQLAPEFANSVAEQWKLAEWCRARKLTAVRELHLRRILQLEPDCIEARHALGYAQIQGRWVESGEIQREQGREYHSGRWRLPQEIQQLEQRSKTQQLVRDWLIRLKSQRQALNDESRFAQFREEVFAIRDPHAIHALLQLMRVETIPALRLLYISTLAGIDHVRASEALINTSLESNDTEVVHRCIDRLGSRRDPGVVDAYVLALRDVRNERVNRAAFALGELADQAAIGPLIEALVTRHQTIISDGSTPETQSATFSRNLSNGNGGQDNASFTAGRGPQVVSIPYQNAEVLAALNRVTGTVGYGYDQRAWQIWYAAQRRVPSGVPVRRD